MLGATGGRIDDVERLVVGLTVAQDGATPAVQRDDDAQRAGGQLAAALREVRKGVDALVPRITSGQTALRDATSRLALLRVPAQQTQSELESALAALDRAGAAGKADPAVQEARRHVALALQAASGRNADTGATAAAGGYRGLDDGAARRSWSSRTSRARQVDDAVRQTAQFADVMNQVGRRRGAPRDARA